MTSIKNVITCILLVGLTLAIQKNCDPSPGIITNSKERFQLTSICPTNSHCLDNGWCACDQGYIGECTQSAFRMVDGTTARGAISNEDYTLFQVLGDPDYYNMYQFTLCHQGGKGFSEKIDVWDDKGVTAFFVEGNAEPGGKVWEVKDNCINLSTSYFGISQKANGQPEGFILGLRLTTVGQVKFSLTVNILKIDFWGLMTKLLFIIGGCFLVTLSIAIAYLVYKWRRRQQFYNQAHRPKDLSHFDQYMPKMKIDSQERQKMHEQICSVCLLEFEDKWLRKTVCGHIFHQECLDQWCKSNLNCPICRRSFALTDLRAEESTIETINSSQLRDNMLV